MRDEREMRDEIRAGMKGQIRFNVATDRIEVIVGAPDASRGAQAVIRPRKNARPWHPTSPGAMARNEALRVCGHLGLAVWRQWAGYHRRSRIETKMHCIKLLGHRLTVRDFNRQITEAYIRVSILNHFTALGIPLTHAVA